jgi:chorismate mutase
MSAVERRSAEPDRRTGSDRRAGRSERRIAAPDERGLTPAEREVARGLAPFRARLDEIDAELVDLLGERFQICREVAVHKSENEIDMMQPGRVEIVRARYLQHGAEVDLPGEFTAGFFDLMIAATCRAEDELMARLAAGDERVHVLGNPLGDKGHGHAAGEAA